MHLYKRLQNNMFINEMICDDRCVFRDYHIDDDRYGITIVDDRDIYLNNILFFKTNVEDSSKIFDRCVDIITKSFECSLYIYDIFVKNDLELYKRLVGEQVLGYEVTNKTERSLTGIYPTICLVRYSVVTKLACDQEKIRLLTPKIETILPEIEPTQPEIEPTQPEIEPTQPEKRTKEKGIFAKIISFLGFHDGGKTHDGY